MNVNLVIPSWGLEALDLLPTAEGHWTYEKWWELFGQFIGKKAGTPRHYWTAQTGWVTVK